MFGDVPGPGVHISVWEVFAVVVAVRLYADYMAGKFWRVRSDNTQVVTWFMKGDAPPLQVSLWLKELASVSIALRFRLTAKHIPAAANCMADALSRQHWDSVHRYLALWVQKQSDLCGCETFSCDRGRRRFLPASGYSPVAASGRVTGGSGGLPEEGLGWFYARTVYGKCQVCSALPVGVATPPV